MKKKFYILVLASNKTQEVLFLNRVKTNFSRKKLRSTGHSDANTPTSLTPTRANIFMSFLSDNVLKLHKECSCARNRVKISIAA